RGREFILLSLLVFFYFKVSKRILPSAFPNANVLPSGESAMEFSEPGWYGQWPRIIALVGMPLADLRGPRGPGPLITPEVLERSTESSTGMKSLKMAHPRGFNTPTILAESLS